MNEQAVTDVLLREFLLGRVTDEERQRLEGLFLTDSELKERMFAAEQELIDDYLEGTLTTADRDRFLLHYGQTAEQQRKLRIAESIKEWAAANVGEAQFSRPAISPRRGFWARFSSRPVLVLRVAAVVILAIVISGVWLSNRWSQSGRRLAIEQELARLNDPSSLREVPTPMTSLDLTPLLLRGAQNQAEIVLRPDVRVVELRLLWMQKEQHSNYRAVIHRVDDQESFTVPSVKGESEGGRVIRVRVQAEILMRGLYKVELSGIAAGASGPAEEYTFTVR